MTPHLSDRCWRFIVLVSAWAAGFLLAMWIAPAKAQECPVEDPQSITYTWTAPTENEDGTPLTNLAGYRLHWGTASGDYDQHVDLGDPSLTTYVLDCLPPSTTIYAAMTAYNGSGLESKQSNEAVATTKSSPAVPNPPENLIVVEDDLFAYALVQSRNRIALVAVGTVDPGTPCDGSQGANGLHVVPREAVDWAGTVRPEVVVARCD